MEPTKEELEAEAERIASGTYYGGPNHQEPFDGDQAAEEADYAATAYYDSISEGHDPDFNRHEAEMDAAMEAAMEAEAQALLQADLDNQIVAQEPPRPYRAPGCTCTDHQLEQVGCDCARDGNFVMVPVDDDVPF